jgi:hypothetical protein
VANLNLLVQDAGKAAQAGLYTETVACRCSRFFIGFSFQFYCLGVDVFVAPNDARNISIYFLVVIHS